MRALADHLCVKALDLPLRATMRTWSAQDIGLHLPLYREHWDAARSLAKGFVFDPVDSVWDSAKDWRGLATASAGLARKRRVVAKFNPYHDERGRFTTADGVGSAAARPKDRRVQLASLDSDIATLPASVSSDDGGRAAVQPFEEENEGDPKNQSADYRAGEDAAASVESVADRSSGSKPSSAGRLGVAVVLPNGSKVPDAYSPTGYLMSPTADLTAVAEAGQKAGKRFQELLQIPQLPLPQPSPLPQPPQGSIALAFLVVQLGLNVGWGGAFDYQRQGNPLHFTHFPQWVDVSNFNVGLFCQQAGLSFEETITIAGTFSTVFHASNRNTAHPFTPNDRQYEFMLKGYKAGESGMFDHRH